MKTSLENVLMVVAVIALTVACGPVTTVAPTESTVPSPGSGRIVFVSTRDEPNPTTCSLNCIEEIYIMNADGSNQTRLTNNSASDGSPAWSPDGKRIAFISDRDGNFEIYMMNADGSNQTRLTNSSALPVAHPAWSPDGKRIAFTSDRDGNVDIYMMNADGSNQTRLTNNPAWDSDPTWSTDGKHIAFDSNRDGNYEIYVMNADGTNQTRLTNSSALLDVYPAWSPMAIASPSSPTAMARLKSMS